MFRLNTAIAYLVGVIHSDGYLYYFNDKKAKRKRFRLRCQVGEKSLGMLQCVQKIMEKEFDRKNKINFDYINEFGTKIYSIQIEINRLKKVFHKLGIRKQIIPKKIMENKKLFCAYLGGVIDGDGNIEIKRPSYPQCEVRITFEKKPLLLKRLIKKHLHCGANITTKIIDYTPHGKRKPTPYYDCRFYISPQNEKEFRKFVLPFVRVKHKQEKIIRFIKTRKYKTRRKSGP